MKLDLLDSEIRTPGGGFWTTNFDGPFVGLSSFLTLGFQVRRNFPQSRSRASQTTSNGFDNALTLSIMRKWLPLYVFRMPPVAQFDTSPVSIGPLRERSGQWRENQQNETSPKFEFALWETTRQDSACLRGLCARNVLLPWKFRLSFRTYLRVN